jgi:hypothetical protein
MIIKRRSGDTAKYKGICASDTWALPEGIKRRKGEDIGRIHPGNKFTSQGGHKVIESCVRIFREEKEGTAEEV